MLRLAPWYINFPRTRRETTEAIEQFKVFCQCRMAQVIGASDDTYIEIAVPYNDGNANYFSRKANHFSRKRRYTISTQGFLGANLVFLDIATRFPGSCHDARNFRNTSL